MARPSDEALARYLNQVGIATIEKIESAKVIQASNANKGVLVTLGDVLVQQGVIGAEALSNIEKKLLSDQPGGVKQLGNYKLIKKLGEGGMGAVFLAEDITMLRKVAVKVLPQKYASEPEFITRFRREAKAAGKLNHPNIVSAFTVGEEHGHHYYVMEYCEGEPLDKRLKREGALSWDHAIDITIQVARGLQHAHQHGFIHRDIKPANIFMASNESGGAPVAKILDMGLSKNIADSEQSFNTQTGVALGTPHYISPEQARGDKGIDGRTDIYSLGAMLYHLVTGDTPFQGSTAAVIMLKHLNEQLPNPQDIRENIPDGVVHVIMKMMTKDPADRYADCAELIADLELVSEGKVPSSHAIEVGKTSIALARTVKADSAAAADRLRKRGGTAPQTPTADKRGGDRRQADRRGEPRNGAPTNSKLYMAAGIGAAAVLILAIVMSGSKQAAPSVVTNEPTPEIQKESSKQPAVAEVKSAKELNGQIAPGIFARAAAPADAVDFQGRKYRLFAERISWVHAKSQCEAAGGHLAYVRNKAINDFVASLLPKETPNLGYAIGGSDAQKEGEWRWLNGEPFTFTSWMPLQPNGGRAENYLGMNASGGWADIDENSPLGGYICEWENVPAASAPEIVEKVIADSRKWQPLFDGKSLEGFGNRDFAWHVENGAIVNRESKGSVDCMRTFEDVDFRIQFEAQGTSYFEVNLRNSRWSAQFDRLNMPGLWGRVNDLIISAREGRASGTLNGVPIQFKMQVKPAMTGVISFYQGGSGTIRIKSWDYFDLNAAEKTIANGVDDAWVKMVQAMPAADQAKAVEAKLRALNPKSGGSFKPVIRDGKVSEVWFNGKNVNDISPIRALSSLEKLTYNCYEGHDVSVDLSPLRGLPLKTLDIYNSKAIDLSPLTGMPLENLSCGVCPFSDSTPLKSLPLKAIELDYKPERDMQILKSITTLQRINKLPVLEFWAKNPAVGNNLRPPNVPGDAIQIDGNWYAYIKVAPALMQWPKLKLRCEELGGRLAMPKSWASIEALVKALPPVQNGLKTALGAYRENGVWKWLDGTTVAEEVFPSSKGKDNNVLVLQILNWQTKVNDCPGIKQDGAWNIEGFYCQWEGKLTDAANDSARWAKSVKLLPSVDLKQDTVQGDWSHSGTSLVVAQTDIGTKSKVELPYAVGAEYDIRAEISINGNPGSDTTLILTKDGKQFGFKFWGNADTTHTGFEIVGGRNILASTSAARLPMQRAGQHYTLMVEVRKQNLKGYVDGQLVSEWKPADGELSAWEGWKLRSEDRIGIGSAGASVTFHSVELIDVSGTGKLLREPPKTEPIWISKDATYTASSASPTNPKKYPGLLSGTGGGYTSYGGVDRDWEFTFHTREEENPYIVIDLGKSFEIDSLEIVNRKSVGPDRAFIQQRAHTLTAWAASAAEGPWEEIWRTDEGKPLWQAKPTKAVNARFIKLGLREKNILHLYSVKVYGSQK